MLNMLLLATSLATAGLVQDLARWQSFPTDWQGAKVADGTATLMGDKWSFLLSPDESTAVQCEAENTTVDVKVTGGGETLVASWRGKHVKDRFGTTTTMIVGFDRDRGTYTYDIDSQLEVFAGGEPFHFRYCHDFEHHTPLDPFRWQYLVAMRRGGALYHRPVYPIDPGPQNDLEPYNGLRVWYGRHGETWIYGRMPFMTAHNTWPTYEPQKNCGAGSGFAMKLGPASYGKARLPVGDSLAKGHYVVTALVKSINAHGPGGRIELDATQEKTNKSLAAATHFVGIGTFDWTRQGFMSDVPDDAGGLTVAFGNAGTGEMLVTDVEFRRLNGGDQVPPNVAARPKEKPPAYAAAPAGAIHDYRMEEGRGYHLINKAGGPHLDLANVDWVVDEGRPAIRFADNTTGRKDYRIDSGLSRNYFSHPSYANWGAYRIVSASAPEFVLEAIGGVKEGAAVSIQKPNGDANQKWIVVPVDDAVQISPAADPSLALSVDKGGNKNGTPIVLEKDRDEAWQRWSLAKHENGSYSLIAKHATEQGLDHFGGRREVGTTIDLWTYKADDVHLQWFIRPLAGSGVVEAKTHSAPVYEPPTIKPEDILPGTTKQFTFTQSKIQPHAKGAFSPWTKVTPNRL